MVNHLYFDVIFTQLKIQKNNGLARYILNSPFYYFNYKTGYVILYLFKIFSNFFVWEFDREKYFFLYFIEPQPHH